MAAAIRDEFGVETELGKGDSGIFDVYRDGELIFSKHETGRFPTEDEVVAALRN